MRRRISRRSYLAGLGLASVAGCMGPSDGATPDSRSTNTSTSASTGTNASQTGTSSTTYHVATDGVDDGPGNEGTPLATIEEAVARVDPGDSIAVAGGIYERDSELSIARASGTEQRPIHLYGKGSERPILQWSDDATDGGLRLFDIKHWHISDLEVRRSPYKGVQVLEGEGVTVEQLSVHDNNNTGVEIMDGTNHVLRNIDSYRNYDPDNDGEDADGIKVTGSEAEENLIEGVSAYRNSDDGIDLWSSRTTTLRRCESWQNGFSPNGDGLGFKLGGGESGIPNGGHRVERCIAYGNWQKGFGSNGSTNPMTVYNTTSVFHPRNYEFHDIEHDLANNLSWNGGILIDDAVSNTTNSWDLDIEEPEFKLSTPTAYLHLSQTSPAIDAGTDVGLDYFGEAPALGAYEFRP